MRYVMLIAICALLAGCSKPTPRQAQRPAPAPVAPAPPSVTPVVGEPEEPEADGTTSHAPGKLKPYRVSRSLAEVSNLAAFQKVFALTDNQKSLLATRLFAASETDYEQLFWVYENNEYHNIPSFVTTDVVLHLYHCFFSYALRTVESETLLPILSEITTAMLAASVEDWRAATDRDAKAAALKNVAYFGVPARLLALKADVPGAAEPLVRKEIGLIEARSGFEIGACFPYKVDYSQFQPRGHYTRSPKLRRFFLAMMWYGLTPFATRMGDGEMAKGPVLQGLLMARNLRARSPLNDWGAIYEPTTFFVGKADDHIAAQWLSVSDTIFGRPTSPNAFSDSAKLERFIEAVERLPGAAIRAEMTLEKQAPGPKHQLRFMGQRYIPDSEVLQRLSKPVSRPFPGGLDVMAVLGSPRAVRLLDGHLDVFNPKNWEGYRPERVKLRKEFAAIPPARWTSNLYWGWLHGLRALLDPIPEGFPSFMISDGWLDKSLGTALGSWAELRHDTILYGKQSAVECGDGEERPTPTGYVEPNVPFYERMLELTRKSRTGLESRELLPDTLKSSFEEFEGLLQFLLKCSRKELEGKLLSEEENREVRYIGGKIEFLTRATMEGRPQYWELVDKGDRDMAVIADVHTAPPAVLQVGVGRASEILVIVPIGRKLVLTRGAIMTYHEFQHPIGDRLTDEKWRAMLKAGKAPEPPFWTRSFLLPKAGPQKNRDQKESYSSP
ncbi:MAG: DUF3160 domain-containing protein, partial [Armatimonadetes bacterium]|nr:DUF3160 domain-containing protein [Armatimonadota bacterium]